MNNPTLAFASGALLFLTSSAIDSLQASEAASRIWWAALVVVAACHAVLGFSAIGGGEAFQRRQWGAAAICAAISTVISIVASVAAILVADSFPIAMGRATAVVLIAASIAIASAAAAVAVAQPLRSALGRRFRVLGR
ncbi:MAG TPA: hypothetical protein VG966_04150 [Hyphomicrobiaceae bacterium]|nr:hypothetical protein [Hyphomicrobiaceae bacterium]